MSDRGEMHPSDSQYPPEFLRRHRPTCHDCDPVECDEVTVERLMAESRSPDLVVLTAREFMATQEGMGQA